MEPKWIEDKFSGDIRDKAAWSEGALGLLAREERIIRIKIDRLDNPDVALVTIYAKGEGDDRPFFVTSEYPKFLLVDQEDAHYIFRIIDHDLSAAEHRLRAAPQI